MLNLSLSDLIAIIAIIWWPLIPLFWIPVHAFPGWFRRLGFFTYLLPFITWLPLSFVLYSSRFMILEYRIELSSEFTIVGWVLLFSGTLLHIWTGFLLNFWGLIGLPEVSDKFKGRMVTSGPFSVARHPTYLAHTIMFFGVFLLSGVIAAGLVTLFDFLLSLLVIIPLEERELSRRFGDEYKKYCHTVPKFFPNFRLITKR